MSDETVNFSELDQYIVLDVPNVTAPVLLQQQRQAIEQFCHETQCWRRELYYMTLREDRTDYIINLDIDDYAVIDGFLKLAVKSTTDTDPRTYRELVPARDFDVIDKQTIRLYVPVIDMPKGLAVTVWLKPSRTATKIDKQVFDNWYMAFVHGTKYRLMVMPNSEFSNPPQAAYHASEFNQAIKQARNELIRGVGMNAEVRMEAPYHFI